MNKKTNHNLGEDMHKTVTDKEFTYPKNIKNP